MIKIVKVLTVLFISIDLFAATVTPSQLEAKILLEKMTGTKIPLTHSLIQPMADKIFAGDRLGAAKLATTHPNFLNITVKLMALGLSTREETLRQDLNDFAAMNEVYGTYFVAPPPARVTVQVARLPRDAKVEIALILVKTK